MILEIGANGKVGICGKIEAFSLDEARIPDAE